MKLNSLAVRLIAALAAWSLVALPLAGFLIYKLYKDDVQGAFDGEIEKLVYAISLDAMNTSGPDPVKPDNFYQPFFESTLSGWYWQVKPLDNPAGKRLVSASLATAELPSPIEMKIAPVESGARWTVAQGPAGEEIRMIEIIDTIGHAENGPKYSIIVAGPWDWLTNKLNGFLARLTAALTLTGLGLLTIALFQVRFGLRPLQQVEKGLAAIRSGEAAKLDGVLPVEIEPLQEELNALIQSNQDIVERARTQVGNLAHALKTPLAVITNEARELKVPAGAKVTEQAQVMRDQITYYLDRARVAARAGVIGQATDIAPVVGPLVRALERINRDKGIVITARCAEGVRFQGEKQDLEEMLGNLLDNACKWARKSVTLDVALEPKDGRTSARRVVMTVSDDGAGLTPEQRSRIGKRGLRLDETKPGTGLGLSIVIDLVQLYRGTLDLGESASGGLSVRLNLPAA